MNSQRMLLLPVHCKKACQFATFILESPRSTVAQDSQPRGTHAQEVLPQPKEKSAMAKIRLNLSSLTVPAKVAKAEQIVTAMTGNASFPTPSPALPTITTAAKELGSAAAGVQAARQAAKEKTSIQNQKEDAIDQLLTQLAGYVESVAGSNEQMILSAGMDTRAPAVPATDPPSQPQALTATAGDH